MFKTTGLATRSNCFIHVGFVILYLWYMQIELIDKIDLLLNWCFFFYQKIWLSVLCVPTIGNALELNLQHAYLVCVHVEAVTYWLTTIVLKVVNWNCNSVFLTSIWSSFWNIFYSVLYFFPQKQVIKIVNPIIYYTALSVIIIRIYI